MEEKKEERRTFLHEQYLRSRLFLSTLTDSQRKSVIFFLIIIIFGITYLYLYSPPSNFPVGKVFSIHSGESLGNIAKSLSEKKVIKSSFVFQSHVISLGGEKRVIAGDYLLDVVEGPVDLAFRMVNGDFHLNPKRITVPEGWSIFEISDYLEKNLIDFNEKSFLLLSNSREGYLFPDTYFVLPTAKPEEIIEKMTETFFEKVPTVSGFSTTTYKIKDVIIMASILEREAITMESRRIISGILWRRIKLGMPLQVDASFSYVNGKNTYELTLDDLKIDSPYNTYLYKGLPPGPIGNPGLNSIFAAIHPTPTKYLYFLTGKNGEMYYAKTFEEHKKNKEKYLR
ncbi:MAG: endolytic transglycosylase MltG [Minisyncoccia bacterium]